MIELIDENPKKGLAYRKAAFSIESLSDLKKITQKKQLTKLPGIGNKIAHMIESLIKQGSLDYYEQLKIRVPSSLLEFVQIPGLSINWIRYFYEKFKITTINEFEELLKSGSLANIKGLNPWKIKKIFRGLSLFKKEGPSLLFPQAKKIALCICESLRNHVLKINITGALRRLCELIYEIDLICISEYPQECISFFKQNQLVKEVSKVTETTVSVILKNGLKANIFFVEPEEYFYELMILTGNRKHLKDLNSQAKTLGFSSFSSLKQKKCTKEEDIYHSLKLPYIYPEMREGLGEVEAANQGKLPSLIKLKDLKGTFHCHTIDSDGTNTLEDLSEGARKLGWEYLGISDHSKSSYQAHGMKEQQLLEQIEKICEINNKNGAAFQLFSGIECDVLKDGQLDLSDEVLKKLDFVIISIHRFFSMKKSEMTKRL
ncbi:MAG: PHP domain-containing protein, partial [Parachlamydiaceae bacterium]|nr:PHP domain-containing protein [Parachlamydiaceae bacterium]